MTFTWILRPTENKLKRLEEPAAIHNELERLSYSSSQILKKHCFETKVDIKNLLAYGFFEVYLTHTPPDFPILDDLMKSYKRSEYQVSEWP